MCYGGHQLRLKCAQVHHQSPAGTFARVPGMCLHWSPTPPGPRYNTSRRRSFTSIRTVHAHPAFGRLVSTGHMRWKWGWKGKWGWDESEIEMKDYLAGTRGGERKRRGKEQTHTNTPGPERANPERAREEKSRGRRTWNKTSGRGGRRKRLSQPDTAKTYAYLGTCRTRPT